MLNMLMVPERFISNGSPLPPSSVYEFHPAPRAIKGRDFYFSDYLRTDFAGFYDVNNKKTRLTHTGQDELQDTNTILQSTYNALEINLQDPC